MASRAEETRTASMGEPASVSSTTNRSGLANRRFSSRPGASLLRVPILAIFAALALGWCCASAHRQTEQTYGVVLRHEAPHLDLKAAPQLLARPGTVQLTAFLRGEPIAPEWACAQEE